MKYSVNFIHKNFIHKNFIILIPERKGSIHDAQTEIITIYRHRFMYCFHDNLH